MLYTEYEENLVAFVANWENLGKLLPLIPFVEIDSLIRTSMRLLWISGRDMSDDLARSTEFGLASGLETLGVQTTMISPGRVYGVNFKHINIQKLGFPGLETLSTAREISKLLS